MLPLLIGLASPALALDVDLGGPYAVDAGSSVELTAEVTDATACTSLEYSWDLDGDGTVDETTTDEPTNDFDAADLDGPVVVPITVGVTCWVADVELSTGRDDSTVEVANVPPVIERVEYDSPVLVGDTVLLSAEVDEIEAEDRLTVSWDFGDDETARGAEVAHAWDAAGTYPLKVVASDDDGGEAVWEGWVEVIEDGGGDDGGDDGGDGGSDSGTPGDAGADSGSTGDDGGGDGGGRDTFVDGGDTGGNAFAPEYEILGTGCSCGSGGAAAVFLPLVLMGWRRRE